MTVNARGQYVDHRYTAKYTITTPPVNIVSQDIQIKDPSFPQLHLPPTATSPLPLHTKVVATANWGYPTTTTGRMSVFRVQQQAESGGGHAGKEGSVSGTPYQPAH